jgi:signal transduction histidine kinase
MPQRGCCPGGACDGWLRKLLNYSVELEEPVAEREALGSAPGGIAVTSLAGSLRYANEAFGRFFDIDVAAHIGRDIRDIARGRLREDFLVSVARADGPRHTWIPLEEGRMLLCTAKRVLHGDFPIYLSMVVQDISDIAVEYRERWRVVREVLATRGIGGCWNWLMRPASAAELFNAPITWASPTETLFGKNLQPGTFHDFMQRVAPDCRERVVAEIARAVQARGSYSVDYELAGRDGSIRPMRSIGRYVEGTQSADGRLIGIEFEMQARAGDGECDDASSRLLEHLELPVVSIERDLTCRYVNPAFAAFAGRAGDRVPQVDRPFLDAVADPAQRRRLSGILLRALKGESSIFEREIPDPHGEVCQWIDFHCTPIHGASGTIEGAMIVGHDVSPLRRANRYHQHLNGELRQRLEYRAAKIDAANRDLSNRVVIACDDLRGDLKELRTMIGTPDAGASGEGSSQRILAALSSMESRLQGLATLAGLGVRRPQRRRIDMNRLVRDVLHDLGALLEGRSVQLDIGALPHVEADRTLVRQVLQSLLSNAIKFTRGCADARIRVWAAVEDETTVWSVADNGAGFDMKHADELFSAFVHHGMKPRGTGLSIAWRAIQQLDGRLWCESSPGQGAIFHFTIGNQGRGDGEP